MEKGSGQRKAAHVGRERKEYPEGDMHFRVMPPAKPHLLTGSQVQHLLNQFPKASPISTRGTWGTCSYKPQHLVFSTASDLPRRPSSYLEVQIRLPCTQKSTVMCRAFFNIQQKSNHPKPSLLSFPLVTHIMGVWYSCLVELKTKTRSD